MNRIAFKIFFKLSIIFIFPFALAEENSKLYYVMFFISKERKSFNKFTSIELAVNRFCSLLRRYVMERIILYMYMF